MIDGIADQVRQRIADALDQRAVEFGIGAVDDQLHFFAARHREVADSAGKPAEDVLDGLQPRLDRRLLQRVGDHVDPLGTRLHGHIIAIDAPQLVAGEHEFAHQVEDRSEQFHINADSGFRGGDGRRRGWRGRRSGGGSRRRGRCDEL